MCATEPAVATARASTPSGTLEAAHSCRAAAWSRSPTLPGAVSAVFGVRSVLAMSNDAQRPECTQRTGCEDPLLVEAIDPTSNDTSHTMAGLPCTSDEDHTLSRTKPDSSDGA